MSGPYTVSDLGTLGGDFAVGAGVNNRGQVVGFSMTAGGEYRAFLHDGERMHDLGTLAGEAASYAWALNDAALVVGSATTAAGEHHAVLWADGAIRDLGTLGGSKGYASAVNNHGQVVGSARLSIADSRPKDEDELLFIEAEDTHAFLWEGGTMRDLGTLGGDYSEATGINDIGQVVGSLITGENLIRAFLLDLRAGSGLRILDPLPGGGYSAAHDINKAGQIVGGSTIPSGTLVPVPYAGEVPRALAIPPGYPITKAVAINARGEMVGHGEVGRGIPGETRALLWHGEVLIDLNDLVQIGPGWVLTEARDINDAGQIVANGQHGERRRAFLLTRTWAPEVKDTARQ